MGGPGQGGRDRVGGGVRGARGVGRVGRMGGVRCGALGGMSMVGGVGTRAI